jgi:hypothetical protein
MDDVRASEQRMRVAKTTADICPGTKWTIDF